jgi:hypothetical protein
VLPCPLTFPSLALHHLTVRCSVVHLPFLASLRFPYLHTMRDIFSPNLFRPAVSILTHRVISLPHPPPFSSDYLPKKSHRDVACIDIDEDRSPTVPPPPSHNTVVLHLVVGFLIDYPFWRVKSIGLPHPPLVTNMGCRKLNNLLGLPERRWNPKDMGATIYLSPLRNNRKKSKIRKVYMISIC